MRGRHATPAHQKAMSTYQLFAWRDAMALASLLEEDYDVKAVRQLFERLSAEKIAEFEQTLQEHIGALLQKPEGHRPAYLRRLAKDHPNNPHLPAFTLLLAIIGQVRVTQLLNLRDMFRGALAPGEGNRMTCANLYDFGMAVARLQQRKPEFPYEVFAASGSNTAFDVEDVDAEN